MRLGIVGAGMIVKDFLTFAPELEDLTISAICGTSANFEKTKAFADEQGIPLVFSDVASMLQANCVDVVYVAVPNHLHFEISRQAIESGKHVICEKPFTSNLKEALILADLAQKQQVYIFEAVSTRFLPNTLKIKELLPDLGQIKVVTTNYSQYSSRYDAFKRGEVLPAFDPAKSGGALMDLNLYNLNFIVTLFGKPLSIDYQANLEKGIDTSGILTLDYGSFKAVCIGAKDCKAPLMNTIQGDKACLTIDSSLNVLSNFKFIPNQTQSSPSIETQDYNGGRHRMVHEFLEFMRIIEERDDVGAQRWLDLSLLTMDLLTQARKKAGIVFAADVR